MQRKSVGRKRTRSRANLNRDPKPSPQPEPQLPSGSDRLLDPLRAMLNEIAFDDLREQCAQAVSRRGPKLIEPARSAFANQIFMDYASDLLCLVMMAAPLIFKASVAKAAITVLDPANVLAARNGTYEPQPSRASVFDASKKARRIRRRSKEAFGELFDHLYGKGKWNVPDRLPLHQQILEEDVRREYRERCSRAREATGSKPADETIFADMSEARAYGVIDPENLGPGAIEHIINPRPRK